MEKYKVSELLEMVQKEGFIPQYAEIITDDEYETNGHMGQAPSNKEGEEFDCLYSFSKCTTNELLNLINGCDFSLIMHDKESLKELLNEEYEDYEDDEDVVAYFTLRDLQGANYGDIHKDVFEMLDTTEEGFREVLDGIIDRMYVYWEDYCIQFED